MTAVTNATFAAAEFNTHVRDNLNETAPAKATVTNRLIITNGANAVREQSVALQSWSPTFTNFTLGSGQLGSGYRVIAGICVWRLRIVFAADTSLTGTLVVSTPFAAAGGLGNSIGDGISLDADVIGNRRVTIARLVTSSTFNLYFDGGSVGATTPFTWANGDEIGVSGAFLTSGSEYV